MVALAPRDVERVFFHLGMGAREGVPEGHIREVLEAVDEVPSLYIKTRILEILDICDTLFNARNPADPTTRFTLREIYAGDINRSVVRDIVNDIGRWNELYMNWTDELAQTLAVLNYRRRGIQALRYSREGTSFVAVVPGAPDTAVGASQFELARLGGSFGFVGGD